MTPLVILSSRDNDLPNVELVSLVISTDETAVRTPNSFTLLSDIKNKKSLHAMQNKYDHICNEKSIPIDSMPHDQ
jgi:hypothetical protein